MPMSSRQSSDTTSSSGSKYAAPETASAMPQKGISLSGGGSGNVGLRSLTGRTIRGQVVGSIEHWADGTVWDVGNNRSLAPGVDFDAAILHVGGF